MTNDQIYEVIKQNIGNVDIKDCGWVSKGVHLIELIVGSKINPDYDKIKKPFLPEFEPDRRILKLDGMEDYNGLMKKLTPIIKYLPENRTIFGKVNEQPIATISNKAKESYYETPKITPVENFDPEVEKIIKGVPPAPTKQEDHMQDFMTEVAIMLKSISNRIDKLEKKK